MQEISGTISLPLQVSNRTINGIIGCDGTSVRNTGRQGFSPLYKAWLYYGVFPDDVTRNFHMALKAPMV
jgi:hypothetical protein